MEGLVAQHLRAWIAYGDMRQTAVYYWRTKSGNEVDFVVYGPESFFAVEVKNARTVHRQDVKSLLAFKADYPQAELGLLYRGEEQLVIDGVRCLPCTAFLRQLVPGRNPLRQDNGAGRKL